MLKCQIRSSGTLAIIDGKKIFFPTDNEYEEYMREKENENEKNRNKGNIKRNNGNKERG